jgi:predicted RNase H-like HicB family nuclease
MSDVIDLTYGANVEPDGDGFLVTFRDVEHAFTYGDTYEEAIFNAQEALIHTERSGRESLYDSQPMRQYLIDMV